MIGAMLFLSVFAAQDAPPRIPPFQPRLNVRIQPPPANVLAVRRALEQREVICGMVVVRKTPADDPRILLPARETGATIRRIEPQACRTRQVAPAK
jgi:hypothetical protein